MTRKELAEAFRLKSREASWRYTPADFRLFKLAADMLDTPEEEKTYAEVKWAVDDVHEIRPGWPLDRCERELEAIEKYLRDRTTELGWEAMDILLPGEDEPELPSDKDLKGGE